MRWADIERAMEVYVGDSPDGKLDQDVMNERLAQHCGDLVPEVKPQLDGDLDLARRCYAGYCSRHPPGNAEEAMANARVVVRDVLNHYATETREKIAKYCVSQGWQHDGREL